MKRLVLGMLVVGGAALLGGCPIYPDSRTFSECETAIDCGSGYACTSQGECIPYPGYEQDASSSSECGACPAGTVCTLSGGTLACLPSLQGEIDGSLDFGDAEPADSGAFNGDDAAFSSPDGNGGSGLDAGSGGALCNADTECTTSLGSKCIDGLCAAQGQLCSDGSQCLVAGDSCVDGICVPPCGGSVACPAGYACDFTRGVCDVNPSACSSSAGCQGGAVCVETRCVAPCAPADSGTQCAAGQACVNGGCIPDQQARFTCQNDGNQGALASTCDPSSVCLHGDCYATCETDGGGCATPGESCKSVTIPKGTFAVCASASTLGSECNAAVGSYCASPKVCIDGYCK